MSNRALHQLGAPLSLSSSAQFEGSDASANANITDVPSTSVSVSGRVDCQIPDTRDVDMVEPHVLLMSECAQSGHNLSDIRSAVDVNSRGTVSAAGESGDSQFQSLVAELRDTAAKPSGAKRSLSDTLESNCSRSSTASTSSRRVSFSDVEPVVHQYEAPIYSDDGSDDETFGIPHGSEIGREVLRRRLNRNSPPARRSRAPSRSAERELSERLTLYIQIGVLVGASILLLLVLSWQQERATTDR